MVFSSSIFLLFFLPLTVIAYYNPITKWISDIRGGYLRNIILVVASLFFYAWGEPFHVYLLMLSIVITFFVGLGVSSRNTVASKTFLVVGIVYHVLMLFTFKYSIFLVSEFNRITERECLNSWNIALPIGISFYTFQLMSYLFDVYYKRADAQKSILSLTLYATMFPQLIAGPIVRYSEISEEIASRKIDRNDFYEGTVRFILGLGKKVLLADYLAYTADMIWDMNERTVLVAWIGALCYTLQIYYDFSGYSDMAIGLGRIFGFHFSENFNYPYISQSVTEFWRRWHISLSSWFRDYVYIPLGGNRVSKIKWIRNVFAVWLLTGIWHGANWTFLCWGMIYFVVLMMEKLTGFHKKLGWIAHVYTMLVVMLAWIMFRSDSLADGIKYIGELFGMGNLDITYPITMRYTIRGTLFTLMVSAVLSAPIVPRVSNCISKGHPGVYRVLRTFTVLTIFVFSLAMVVGQNYTAFIYFNF